MKTSANNPTEEQRSQRNLRLVLSALFGVLLMFGMAVSVWRVAHAGANAVWAVGEIAILLIVLHAAVLRAVVRSAQKKTSQHTAAELEKLVATRTTDLQAANERLVAEVREKEDFLRAVSHDLTAPLRNIAGMATMLLMKHREKFDEDVIHRLERIQKNVTVESNLIGELLELSHIKARRQKMETVNVGGVIRELRETFEDDLRTRKIQLIVEGEMPSLSCERARMRQVFQNLIDNGIKYMGDEQASSRKKREIRIGCVTRPMDVEFYVKDTGIGIDEEDMDKVFFIFRRGRNSTVQNIPGRGVGLACVKSIVETYGGLIRVESKVGEGSRLTFTIDGRYVAKDEAASDTASSDPRPAVKVAAA